MLPKMRAYRRDLHETFLKILIFFMIKNLELLEKYNGIWDKVSDTIKKRFDTKPVHNGKHLRTKIKSYEEKISTNF